MQKIKIIEPKEIELIRAELTHAQSPKRRAAAKKIGKFILKELKEDLLKAYSLERKDPRTWETQKEMIQSLGRVGCIEALPYLEEIINENVEFDAITDVAASAYVRLKSKGTDYMPVIYQLFEKGRFAVLSGAIQVLFYDQIALQKDDIVKLAKLVNESNHPKDNGLLDLRESLACAMSIWPKEIVTPYLQAYKDIPTISNSVIEHALQGEAYCASEY